MNNLALLGASQSISDLISNPQIMTEGYLENQAPLNVVNAYEHFNDLQTSESEKEQVIWDQATWYISPTDPTNFLEI